MRALPVDSVVLIGGCDKTTPAQVMAAVSADRPTIVLPVGPMLVGHFKGEVLGACTDCRRLWGEFRGGRISGRGYRGRERAAGAVGRHLRGDGHRVHHRLHDGSDGHDAAGRGDDARGPCRSHAHRGSHRQAAPPRLPRPAGRSRRRSSPRMRSAMPSSCCRRSAARPTAWCISPPLPAARKRRCRSRNMTRSARRRRCWSI